MKNRRRWRDELSVDAPVVGPQSQVVSTAPFSRRRALGAAAVWWLADRASGAAGSGGGPAPAGAPARAPASALAPASTESAEPHASVDAALSASLDEALQQDFSDIDSLVMLWRGRTAHSFHRDGDAQRLRDTQSVAKSLLSMLVGIAIGRGHLGSVDMPLLQLVPEWRGLNADPRSGGITLRHLLTMTAGFAVQDPRGNAPALAPQAAWQRPMAFAPGERFAYDNSTVPLLVAALERAVRMPLAAWAGQALVEPLGLRPPGLERGLFLRTADMARLGQLMLQGGRWGEQQIIPAEHVVQSTRVQNPGGPPVSMPYGYLWWILPSAEPRPTFFASGWGGQLIWVSPALKTVIAITSPATPASQGRGHATRLLRQKLLPAAIALAQRG